MRLSDPVRDPGAAGAKNITMVQAWPTFSVTPQVLEAIAKSPFTVGGVNVSGTPPLLVTVTVCGAEFRPTPVVAKEIVPGVTEIPGGAMPVPPSETV